MEFAFLPNWLLARVCPDPESRLNWNAILSPLVLIGFLASPLLSLSSQLPHCCLVKRCFSLPCPGCGITTSLVQLFRGEWQASIDANFAGCVLILGMLLQVGLHSVSLAQPAFRRRCRNFSGWINTLMLAIVAVSWSMRLTHL